jgi:tRNA 2-thiouridine synthesizing protein A
VHSRGKRPVRTLDTMGMLCPLPILLAVREMARLAPQEILELVGDDPGLVEDVPAWCLQSGHVLLSMDHEGRVIRALVRRGPNP